MTDMNETANIRPFDALTNGMQGFLDAVKGEPGRQLLYIKDRDANDVIPGIIKGVLPGICDILSWFYHELDKVKDKLDSIDPGIACFEVCGETMTTFIETIPKLLSKDLIENMGIEPIDLTGLVQVLKEAKDSISRIGIITDLIPSPENTEEMGQIMKQLLGTEVEKPYEGAIGELFEELNW